MSTEPNEILNTTDLALEAFNAGGTSFDELADAPQLNATRDPEPGISFHVQMQGYTKAAMDDLIVEVAARQLVGGRTGDLAKHIEAKCIDMLTARADSMLQGVTQQIIDQPLIPSFGDKKPVTMREYLGLTGREYLVEKVDRDGKPSSGGWGAQTMTRIEWLVDRAMQREFKKQIEAATSAVLAEVQKAIRDQHAAFLDAEKARFRAALTKLTA